MEYADIASLDDAEVIETFKKVYLTAVDAVPDGNVLTAQMNRTKRFKAGPDGLYFKPKLQTGGKVGNVGDGKLLPNPSRPRSKQGRVDLVNTYTVIAVGGQSIALTKGARNAFVSNLEEQTEDGLFRVKTDVERQYNGDGRGILCVIETVAGAPTYGAHKAGGITNGGPGTMNLIEGMECALVNPGDGTERGRFTIVSIDPDNDEFTASGIVPNDAIGDYVVLVNNLAATGDDADTNYLNEANGIGAWINDDDEFEGIDADDFRRWRGTKMANGGVTRRISEKLVATLEARLFARSGKRPTLFYTSAGISIDFQDQMGGLRRFDGEREKLKAGYSGIKIGNRTVVEGPFCPKGHFFGLNMSDEAVGMIDVVPMGYVDMDGSRLHRVEGRHVYRADLWFPHQAIVFLRAAQGAITDLIDDDTIVR